MKDSDVRPDKQPLSRFDRIANIATDYALNIVLAAILLITYGRVTFR